VQKGTKLKGKARTQGLKTPVRGGRTGTNTGEGEIDLKKARGKGCANARNTTGREGNVRKGSGINKKKKRDKENRGVKREMFWTITGGSGKNAWEKAGE